jgi:HAD superfamily hydrolase (TIGR01509 family)
VREERPPEAWFDVVIVSCEVGLSKPETGIYELCLRELGVPAHQALFADDREDNIQAAARLGIRTLHFVDDHAVDTLRELIAS